MSGNGKRSKARAGVTLVEVMFAGAVVTFTALTTFEGFIFASRIAHENAELLCADNFAFDLLWRKFYGDYEQMRSTVGQPLQEMDTSAAGSPYRSTSLGTPPSYRYTESVSNCYSGKLISIDLRYGSNGQYTRHLEVFRSDIPRSSN